jgi:hypothetical protein
MPHWCSCSCRSPRCLAADAGCLQWLPSDCSNCCSGELSNQLQHALPSLCAQPDKANAYTNEPHSDGTVQQTSNTVERVAHAAATTLIPLHIHKHILELLALLLSPCPQPPPPTPPRCVSPSLSCRLRSAPASTSSLMHFTLPMAATKCSALQQQHHHKGRHIGLSCASSKGAAAAVQQLWLQCHAGGACLRPQAGTADTTTPYAAQSAETAGHATFMAVCYMLPGNHPTCSPC